MAKKVEGYIKLQIPAGKATPAPPVGPGLGQRVTSSQVLQTQRRLRLQQFLRLRFRRSLNLR